MTYRLLYGDHGLVHTNNIYGVFSAVVNKKAWSIFMDRNQDVEFFFGTFRKFYFLFMNLMCLDPRRLHDDIDNFLFRMKVTVLKKKHQRGNVSEKVID